MQAYNSKPHYALLDGLRGVWHVGDVHLVLNFDYEVPSEPGSGGPGFDVDVDDWDDVNVDIVL